ncbi:unnamed protein product [Ambrosiozyma monospora]|uniref:Unnamed protein product n=1 Tax=Ambrosiozyma monospora TaxID=43982 RepID=A0ACB5SSK3_AMBMO|nr:unnamed protein product [Ambrosiozyma monospora]
MMPELYPSLSSLKEEFPIPFQALWPTQLDLIRCLVHALYCLPPYGFQWEEDDTFDKVIARLENPPETQYIDSLANSMKTKYLSPVLVLHRTHVHLDTEEMNQKFKEDIMDFLFSEESSSLLISFIRKFSHSKKFIYLNKDSDENVFDNTITSQCERVTTIFAYLPRISELVTKAQERFSLPKLPYTVTTHSSFPNKQQTIKTFEVKQDSHFTNVTECLLSNLSSSLTEDLYHKLAPDTEDGPNSYYREYTNKYGESACHGIRTCYPTLVQMVT